MTERRTGGRMKPPVFFPGMGSPLETEIRRMELDEMFQVRAAQKEKIQ